MIHLRLLDLPLRLLIHFGTALFKEGCQRMVNGKQDLTFSDPRVNQIKDDLTGRTPTVGRGHGRSSSVRCHQRPARTVLA